MDTLKYIGKAAWSLQANLSIYLTGHSVLDEYINKATRSLLASIATPIVSIIIAVLVAWLTARLLPVVWTALWAIVGRVLVWCVALLTGFAVFALVVRHVEPYSTPLIDNTVAFFVPPTSPPPPPPLQRDAIWWCPGWAWWSCNV